MRNVKPLWSKFGLVASLVLGGFDMWVANVTGWNPLGTIKHGKTDAAATGKASDHEMLNYPRADGKLSFDRLTNVSFLQLTMKKNNLRICNLPMTPSQLALTCRSCRARATVLPGRRL